ncbi:response regulator [Burkholderia stagnalis]|uniref:hypothetical protein n=1 Tax=Burkholderia stagnalis TaxID=1503054 RepID=UPI002ED64C44
MLLDLLMPDVDGIALLCALRSIDALRCTRFVAVSGLAQPSDRLRAARAGFDGHLVRTMLRPHEITTLMIVWEHVATNSPFTSMPSACFLVIVAFRVMRRCRCVLGMNRWSPGEPGRSAARAR